LTHFFVNHGLPLLFVVVMLESFGLPLPGETALIAFGILAAQGHYSIVWVIVLAAVAAIIGDNLGYWLLGRLGGRALFRRCGLAAFYGGKAVADAIQRYGLYAAGVIVVVLVGGWFVLRLVKHRVEDSL